MHEGHRAEKTTDQHNYSSRCVNKQTCVVWTGPLIQDGRFYTVTGLSAGLNLSWAMIQEDYGAYVAASLGWELLSMRFSHEAVNHVVRVKEISRHRPVWSDAPDEDARARARNVELVDVAVFITHKAVIRV